MSGKMGNFAKSCYEPVQFTCHIGNVLAAVVQLSLEPNEILKFHCILCNVCYNIIILIQKLVLPHFPDTVTISYSYIAM